MTVVTVHNIRASTTHDCIKQIIRRCELIFNDAHEFKQQTPSGTACGKYANDS